MCVRECLLTVSIEYLAARHTRLVVLHPAAVRNVVAILMHVYRKAGRSIQYVEAVNEVV